VAETIGMPMTWVPPLHGWVGTNEVTQDEYAKAGMAVTSHYRGAKRPVDSVSWNDAMKFCELLNRMEREAGRLPEGFAYALPTDEQWKTYVGDAGVEQAVFGRTEAEGTAEVSSKPPNVFGLYDVMGNLWEWTADWHPAHVGKERALRGGGYASRSKEIAMADARYSGSPTNRYRLYGFRVVLVKTPAKPAAAD
jgi:formylglycine-generating enzyme required for sulfatase activity